MTAWEAEKLVNLCNVFDDGDWVESKDQSETGIRLVQTGNVGIGLFKDRAEKARYISQETFKRLRCTEILEGDILVSRLPDPVGRACIIPKLHEQCITAVDCTIIRVDPAKVLAQFLKYYFQSPSYFLDVQDKVTGATRQRISRSSLGLLDIPLPPLAIQKAIVAKLDAAFASIDTAIAAAEKNAGNAKQLFQSYLSDVFERGGTGWEEKKLSEITTKIGSGATPRGGDASYKPSGIPLIRSLNIYDDGFHYRKLAFLDEEQADALSNVIVEENDVLLNITGASIARCCVPPADVLPARVNQHVSIIRPIINAILPKFLQYLLTSNFYKSSLLEVGEGSGATRQALTKSQLQNFIVSFPRSLQKQSELITELFEVETLSKKMMEMYEGKSLAYKELKQSLLQQAFSGQLVDA